MGSSGKTSEIIVNDIEKYILTCPGKYYSEFYIGITNDPEIRLFSEHHVDIHEGCWTFHRAIDIEQARAVEKNMLDKGMKGGPGGGTSTSIYVYCYQMTAETIE